MSSADPPISMPAGADTGVDAAGVDELFALLTGTRSVEGFLTDLMAVAAGALGVSCGITMRRSGEPLTVVSSDVRASAVDEVQYELGQGPCLQSLDTGQPVSVPDLLDERRWDSYPAHALSHGMCSSLSLPLATGQGTAGALNLYAPEPHAFTDAPRSPVPASSLPRGSAVLSVALRQAEQAQLTEQLREALTSRTVIDQALGIVMSQQRCDATTAFAVLRAASQGRNRKLRDIATDIVTSVSGTPPV